MTVYVTRVRGLRAKDGLLGGALAGAVQSLALLAYGLFDATPFGALPNLLTNLIGQTPDPNAGFGGAALLGLLINIVILMVLGGLFAVAARQVEGKVLLWSALAYGVIVWAIGYFLLLPVWAPELRAGLSMLTALSSLLVYGSVLGAFLMRRQRRELVDRY